MSKVETAGISFSVRHASDILSLNKSERGAKEAYVDDNAQTIIIEAGDDDSSASIILDRDAAARLHDRLTEALE